MKSFYTIAFFLAFFISSGQSLVLFEGLIIEDKSKDPVPNVTIVNVRDESLSSSNADGKFSIKAKEGDTLVFSKPGFAYRYSSAYSNSKAIIDLLPQNFLLEEVPITAYKLTSNLPKQMPIKEPARPTGEDIMIPQSVKPTLANPIDFLYDQFGKRPRQLRELKAILDNENYRQKLAKNNNRNALFELTGLTSNQIEELLLFCTWDKQMIQYKTDYELLLSLYRCYQDYIERQKIIIP
ncbi:MAG: hypothetical protein P8I92_01965 [Schleiferiaceae bacterium]|nr:hypothetical protein [Schleiferiaceae bacterium]